MAWANLAALARDAIPEMKSIRIPPSMVPCGHQLPSWMRGSIAATPWMRSKTSNLSARSIILVVHELKRLQAIFTEEMKDKAVHSDDIAVDRFASAMKTKLAQKRAEGKRRLEDKTTAQPTAYPASCATMSAKATGRCRKFLHDAPPTRGKNLCIHRKP
ncbi:hypothetical protein [Xanthobacter sp. 91]|uniref:hypothetical protein n=1 Tax=Xanthobacter sp. 91 TaxID=1117244 RepID=UPI0012DF6259|nr:hypothetical protein [Xanthobacter sp. 91]